MTSRRDSSRAAIATVARALCDERRRVVFVGGTVVALYPLEGGADVRPTVDVDCIVDVTTLGAYYAFVERLRALGFGACTDEGAPLCRLVVSGIRVDVMGSAETALGPTNRWYAEAIAAAEAHSIAPDLEVLAISPVHFVATKLEAFHSRGRGDYAALDEPRIDPVLTPALREQIEDRGILAGGRPPAQALLQLVQLLDPRVLPALRSEHARVPERDRQRDRRTRVVDGRRRAEALEQRRGELEDALREVALGQADDGPRVRVSAPGHCVHRAPDPISLARFHRSKNPRRRSWRLRIATKRLSKPAAVSSRVARSRRSRASFTASS